MPTPIHIYLIEIYCSIGITFKSTQKVVILTTKVSQGVTGSNRNVYW